MVGIWRVGIAGDDDRSSDGMFPGDKKRTRESGGKPAVGVSGRQEAGGARREERRSVVNVEECGM